MVFKFRTPSFSDNNLEEYPMILRKFSLPELRAATQNFSCSNILAEGTMCTVYRGLLLDGSIVAIKRPKDGHAQHSEARFLMEVRHGSNIMARHPNVLRLVGFCRTKNECLLVYALVATRSLVCCLRKSPNTEAPLLDWITRKKIALGVACGLAHLQNLGIVHQDVRASRIWLDWEFSPVLADFGLDLVTNEEDTMGEDGHWSKDCRQKNDVLAYGNILLKLVTGARTFGFGQVAEDDADIFLGNWVKQTLTGYTGDFSRLVDPSLQGNYDEDEAQLLVCLGLLCTHSDPARRPEMSEVVKILGECPTPLPKVSGNIDEQLLDYSSGHLSLPKMFSLDELQMATRKFGPDNLLGEGGFSAVYWGKLADGSLVAVKRLRSDIAENAERQFETEVMIGSNRNVQHPNLLRLIGFCCEESESLLVYPLMINNSLEYHLRCSRDRKQFPALDWPTRKRIALGAARGLTHLHDQFFPSIIHRDICPSNILLDAGFNAVVGDFGWARLMNEGDIVEGAIEWSFSDELPISPHLYRDTYVNTFVRGTDGYVASEYKSTGKCSLKSDVFAFGNLLLELISLDWETDKDLQVELNMREAERLIDIAQMCVHRNPSMRPKMREVVRAIEGL